MPPPQAVVPAPRYPSGHDGLSQQGRGAGMSVEKASAGCIRPVPRSLPGFGEVLARLPAPMAAQVGAAYRAPSRHYHDAGHIGGLWRTWTALGLGPGDPAFLLAIAYHDLVYRAEAAPGQNERDSAASLLAATQHAPAARQAAGMILATADHLSAEPVDQRLFCDLDLSGLAADWEEFLDGSLRVRAEYPHLDAASFWQGRRRFWQRLLAAPAIFRSGCMPASWEASARANLQRQLQGGAWERR
jgi:predicted metal-dependent HD superfamily phosphohydrolase